MVTAAMNLRHLLLGRKVMTNLDSILKSFADKGPSSQSYGFSGSYVWMWEVDHKKGWVLRNWCFWIVVLEQTFESPLDVLKEISPEYSLEGLVLKLNSLAAWCKELTHEKRTCCWERLKAGGEGVNRGWDGWMASPTLWTWVWVSSGCW